MIITQLDISGFRNLTSFSAQPHPRLNLITGNNGAGKSSVLEAIQSISTGHSFRTRRPKELINKHFDYFSVAAAFCDPLSARNHRAGLKRTREGKVEVRLNFEEVQSIAEVTQLIPVKSLYPDSHKLIQEGPDERRQFLDWGLFHVEPRFFQVWKDFKRALLQRNTLLRETASIKDIRIWDAPYIDSALLLDGYRRNYVNDLSQALNRRIQDFPTMFHVELVYKGGWNQEQELAELMQNNIDYHRRMKTTTDGPHRAELLLTTDGLTAKQILSRGQQKTLVYLLHLAQLDLLRNNDKHQAIILCDDLTSELDTDHCHYLIDQLLELNGQIFVSGVELGVLTQQEHTMFHMEHGVIENIV